MEGKPISNIQYPPGIRFHPSDEELISYYLERKVKSLPLPANVITDIELYNYNPWDLPRKTLFGEDEWYFFTPRDRKYPNGGRPNRTAASGYWKATGTDKPILSSCGSREIGVKKALVFYKGKPPSGLKMDWNMTEYRLPDARRPSRSRGSMRLDDWVLCRIRQKGNMSKNEQEHEQNWCEFRDSSIKELPSLCIQDSREMLADYLQSSEYNQIVSLLAGRDPGPVTIPITALQGHTSGSCSRTIHEDRSGIRTTQANFSSFQSSFESMVPTNMIMNFESVVPTNMIMNKQEDTACQSEQMVATMRTSKCKPNYPSNACINLRDLDMPPLQEDFLQ